MAKTSTEPKKDTHPCAGLTQDIPGKLKVRVGKETRLVDHQDPEDVKIPLMVACGVGVDSVAMLILLYMKGIRPDAILFADVGSEKPETYAYLEQVLQPWLKSVGFPAVQVVRKHSELYSSLYENCVANETLPSLVYNLKGCSMKWKVEPQDAWARRWEPAYTAWAHGHKVIKMIGYDASPADMKRYAGGGDTKCYQYQYPLREANMTRDQSKDLIRSQGLPIPTKSSCFFCPAMKTAEIDWLRQHHPELVEMALEMERGYKDGKHYRGPNLIWSTEYQVQRDPKTNRKMKDPELKDEHGKALPLYVRDPLTGRPIPERYKRKCKNGRRGDVKRKAVLPVQGLFGQGKDYTWTDYIQETNPDVAAQMESDVSCDYREDDDLFAKGYPV